MSGTQDWDLEVFYLNHRRLSQLLGADAYAGALGRRFSGLPQRLAAHAETAAAAEILREWLVARGEVPTIEEIILRQSASQGTLFTAHRDFYGRGLKKQGDEKERPLLHTTYSGIQGDSDVKLKVWLHHSHLASGSPADYLSGHAGSVFVLGSIQTVSSSNISAAPIIIGRRVNRSPGLTFPITWTACEVTIDQIDSFSKVRNEQPATSFDSMKGIPEEEVKNALRSIIGEPIEQKDWGGETSDLFTTRVVLAGERVPSAFVLKGPARWGTMTLAHLGKNGDQICRLSSEPADLLVVQHCCKVHNGVRVMLRAFCNQVGARQRRFCIIDGYDSVRLLRAYGQCGLEPLGPADRRAMRSPRRES